MTAAVIAAILKESRHREYAGVDRGDARDRDEEARQKSSVFSKMFLDRGQRRLSDQGGELQAG